MNVAVGELCDLSQLEGKSSRHFSSNAMEKSVRCALRTCGFVDALSTPEPSSTGSNRLLRRCHSIDAPARQAQPAMTDAETRTAAIWSAFLAL